MDSLIIDLYDKKCIKFGNFRLKSGLCSPIYIDLKEVVGHPYILNKICELIITKIRSLEYDAICGVPYGGIPYASIICNKIQKPLVILRKEKKGYGSKKLCEGVLYDKMKLLLLEDTMSTGSSVIETIKKIKKSYKELIIDTIILICDRRGTHACKELNTLNIHSIFNIHDIINTLLVNDKITDEIFNGVYNFMYNSNTLQIKFSLKNINTNNNVIKRLITIIKEKKTNLVFSADIHDFFKLVKIVSKIGKHICILKIHCDIIENFNLEKATILKKLAEEQQFLIFEDRKFTDIGNTFINQYTQGSFKISEWADIITINTTNSALFSTFANHNKDLNKAILPVCDMSNESLSAFELHNRKNKINKLVDEYKDHIIGIVTQKREDYMINSNIFYFTPGVNIISKTDDSDQRYRTPQKAILVDNCDLIIVGRGIYSSEDIYETARQYKAIGWNALSKRTKIL